MKTTAFAVSVQWGKGHHYFIASDLDTKHQADLAARGAQLATMKVFEKKKGRAPQPHVYVWQRVPAPGDL